LNKFIMALLKSLFSVVLVAAFSSHAVAEDPIETVDELLQRASTSLQEQNYSGRFTYEFGSTLETLEIVHIVKDGVEVERISHLNGARREFLSSGREKDCVSSGGILLRGGLISASGNAISLSQNYHFYIRGSDRIAGRNASVIQAVPKDQYRYGVTLAVDRQSGLPLMSTITSEHNSALERFQFVQLAVGSGVNEDSLKPTDDHYATLDSRNKNCGPVPSVPTIWQAAWVPPGFVLSHANRNAKVDTLTYTDGLASFTLFISAKGQPQTLKTGLARRGATTALMTALSFPEGSMSIVLVGEIPTQTAQQVVASLRPTGQ
jgi:sigma-E factor negative regulatory protein RseB